MRTLGWTTRLPFNMVATRMVTTKLPSRSTIRCTTIMAKIMVNNLTKWVPAAKLEQSLRYACNAHERRGLSLPKEV